MSARSRVRVYMACSLDGYVAGVNDDLSWLVRDHSALGDLPADEQAVRFETFMSEVGVMLMGRTTYDVVAGFDEWPYGQTPILVATRRPLVSRFESVEAVSGSISDLVKEARRRAGERDIYVDGADLVRQAVDAGLVDELIITYVPYLLTQGTPLFLGLKSQHELQVVSHRMFDGGLLQVTFRPRPAKPSSSTSG